MLELNQISKKYSDVSALEPCDLSVAPGQTTALIGPSGCGKSTILRLIIGLETPNEGSIRIGGQLLESYLQRCAFDYTLGLAEMRHREPLAGYLAACHDLDSGDYRFPQRVGMVLFSHTEAGLTLRDTKISGIK